MHSVESSKFKRELTRPQEKGFIARLLEEAFKPESKFCYTEAVIAVTGATLEVGYNGAFLFFMFMNVKYLNRKKVSTKYYHAVVVVFLIGTIAKQSGLFGGAVGFGRSKYGSCSVHFLSTSSLVLGFTSMIMMISLSVSIIFYVKKVLP